MLFFSICVQMQWGEQMDGYKSFFFAKIIAKLNCINQNFIDQLDVLVRGSIWGGMATLILSGFYCVLPIPY